MLLFLAVLQVMDSFKLVRLTSVVAAIIAGGVVALACLSFHEWLVDTGGVSGVMVTRYVAPATEEALKGAFIAVLLWRRRVGFLVDAVVQGFAVGTGFALVENVDYLLQYMGNASAALWLVRGVGTAILHGATTAIFAMIMKTVADRREDRLVVAALPGLGLAFVIHSAFNHVLLSPFAMTALLLLILPIAMLLVFQRSERATREWVGAGLDLDVELLDLVRSEQFAFTRFGRYLNELRTRFGGTVAADMFCLLRVELELSIQARAMLMAREAGLKIPITDDLSAALQEVAYLRASIGPTGLLALKPLQVTSGRDLWHRHLLTEAVAQSRFVDRRARWLRAPARSARK